MREQGTAMLQIAAKTHQTIGWQAGGTTIIRSDAKHQEWKLRFLGGRGAAIQGGAANEMRACEQTPEGVHGAKAP